jgi:hypothetical protein
VSGFPFHDGDFFLGQAVKLLHDLVDQHVGEGYAALDLS